MTMQLDASLVEALAGRAAEVNRGVMEEALPDITYPQLVPVNTAYPEWATGATAGSWFGAGEADFLSGNAKDVPVVELAAKGKKFDFEMFGVGYRWNIEEIGIARNAGIGNLTDMKARVARRKSEEFAQAIAMVGRAAYGFEGLTNLTGATVTNAGTQWRSATALTATVDQILANVNTLVLGPINANPNAPLVVATTIAVDPITYRLLASTPAGVLYGTLTILQVIQGLNAYSQNTGTAVQVVAIPELARAAATPAGGARAIGYANRSDILELPMPMPYRFEPAYQDGPLQMTVPGIGRLAGVQLLNPNGLRYLDNVAPVPAP